MLTKYIELLNRLMEEADDGKGGGGAADESGNAGDNNPNDNAGDDDAGGEGDADPNEGDAGGDTGDADKGDADAGEEGESDSYSDFTLPEGMELDQEMLNAFTPALKEMGLTQEQVQGLVDVQAKLVQEQHQKQIDAHSQQVEQWGEDASTDKEYGGDNFEQSAGLAQKAIDTFGTPELKTVLEDYGFGNHPELVRLLYRVGKAMGEDKPGGGQSVQTEQDRKSILYPNN